MSRRRPMPALAAMAAALLLAVLSGCATRIPPDTVLTTPRDAWTAFRQNYCDRPDGKGVRVKASLQYSRTKPARRTNRTLVSLWGDFNGAMRLDVSASIGRLLAHIREDKKGLLVFYPEDNKAYAHQNAVLGATRLGMPFPFSLSVLASALAGDFSGLAPRRYAEAGQAGENFTYTLKNGPVSRIVLDRWGRPVRFEGITEAQVGWTFDMDRYEDAVNGVPPLPDKLTLALDNGEQGVLHIKSLELMLAPWPARSLELALPEDVTPIRLDNGYVDEKTGEIPVVYEEKQ